MIDVFEIGASLNVHGNGMDFMHAFSGLLAGAHGQLDALEKKLGATKGAMKDLFVGAGEVFAGVELLKGVKDLAEAGKELNHQQSMLMRNGVSQRDVMRETASIYKDMLTAVPTASAVDFLRTLGELKSVKGSIAGAREALTQSLKIEGLIGNSTGKSAEGQGYDFWRAVEDKGIIQNKAKTDAMLNRMVQGTIATGGKVGGNDWFTYARRAGSAWMGDDIDALPLQLMEMQTLGPSGAGVARRAFANRTEGAIKLTKAQMAGWNEIGMLEPGGKIKDSSLEQSRPDLFIGQVIEALKAHGLDTEAKVKAWSAHALHGKDADYFMTAYAGMSEVDPESGLTRLQKERRNMGEAQPLDKAYKTMMGTDFEANVHAFQEQWKSFTEALGGPATKAAIPVLQEATAVVTKMAAFADQHQKLTQIGVDVAAVAGGLLVLGGSLTIARGALRLAGGGLIGMGRKALGGDGSSIALKGSATALDESALALKEAAAELRAKSGLNGSPGGAAAEAEKDVAKYGAGASPFFLGAGIPAAGALAILGGGAVAGAMKAPMVDEYGRVTGNFGGDPDHPYGFKEGNAMLKHRRAHNPEWLGARVWHGIFGGAAAPSAFHPADDDRTTRSGRDSWKPYARDTDSNALRRHDDELSPVTAQELRRAIGVPGGHPTDDDRNSRSRKADALPWELQQLQEKAKGSAWTFGQLDVQTGIVKTSFGELGTGSGGLKGAFGTLEATAYGAARALATVALGGNAGVGGGGITNASYEGGGFSNAGGGQRFGSASGMHPAVAHALGLGSGGGIYVGSGGTAEAAGAGFTAGMRARNLGNIGYFHQHTAGLIGPSNSRDVDHSIALFGTQEDGIRAAANLALHKYLSGRHSTWDLIAAKGGWTPGALGPGASVNVARAMGLSNRDDIHLDRPEMMHKFLRGLAVQEHGPAGRYYSDEMIDRALGNRAPVAGPPSRSKTVGPGRPAAGQPEPSMTTAMNLPPIVIEYHHHTYMDTKKVAHEVTRHQVASNLHHRSVGPTDNYGSWLPPGGDMVDVA